MSTGQVEEVYGGHTIVKAFNGEESALKEFEKANDTLYHSAWKSQFLSGLIHPVMNFVGNVGYVAVAILRRISCHSWKNYGWKYPILHPIQQAIYPAN